MPFPPYPSEFYYEEKGNEDTYSFTPQGELDVDRFIRNEAPWKKTGAVEQKKKTIVLHDMFWKNENLLDFNQIYYMVRKLQRDGFEVILHPFVGYLSHDASTREQQLHEWYNILLNNPDVFESTRDVMASVKEKYALLPDQMHVVNAYWLNVLVSSLTVLPDYVLTPYQLIQDVDEAIPREYIYEQLKNSNPPVTKIVCNDFNELNTVVIQECRKHFPDAKVDFPYVFVNLNENQLQKLANGKLTLNGEVITLKDLSETVYFNVIGDIKDIEKAKNNIDILIKHSTSKLRDIVFTRLSESKFSQLKEHIINTQRIYVTLDSPRDEKALEDMVSHPVDIPNPVHNPTANFNIKPTGDDFIFQYKGKNKTLNQGMVIEQLSQYLLLQNRHLEFLPKLNDGMCAALSQIFGNKSTMEFNALLTAIRDWDGEMENVNPALSQYFEEILAVFKSIYIQGNNSVQTYLGDNLIEFLELSRTLSQNATFTLTNPWHAISVKYSETENAWLVYDPNFVTGALKVAPTDLQSELEKSLGKLIAVQNVGMTLQPKIDDTNAFLRDGGLLNLCHVSNVSSIFNLLPLHHKYSNEALSGILLRDVHARAAWMKGLLSNDFRLKKFTCDVLIQFALENRDTYAHQLITSIADIPEREQYYCIEALIMAASEYQDAKLQMMAESVRNAMHIKQLTEKCDKQFETWNKQTLKPQSTLQYCQDIVNGQERKRLIELTSTQTVQTMGLALQQHCSSIHRPFFYVNSPDDLICSAPYVERNKDNGELKRGPGGPLHDFLLAHQDPSHAPVIIINYDNFSADDIIRFNSILDKVRKVDGTAVPESTIVVGLINPAKSGCYQGEDFYSRFGKNGVDVCKLTPEQLLPGMSVIPVKSEDFAKQTYPINLCHAKNWKERLLGRWVIKKDKLFFEEGFLAPALRSGLPIEIQNGLWSDPSFSYFWEQARVLGYFPGLGKELPANNTSFIRSEGYDWKNLLSHVTWNPGLQADLPILNPTRFNDYFKRYHCDNETRQLDTLFGLIKENEGKTLSVNLTRTLNEDQWAALLIECQQYHVTLQCHYAPSITLPDAFNIELTPAPAPMFDQKVPPVIANQSDDVDAAVEFFIHENKGANWKVIDISECTANDLLMCLNASFHAEKLHFEFTETARVLKNAIDNNENIILKGKFSPELADGLASLVIEKNAKKTQGQVCLFSSDISNLNYAPRYNYNISLENKAYLIGEKLNLRSPPPLNIFQNSSFNQALSVLNYDRAQLYSNPWAGLFRLPGGVHLKPFDTINSKEISDAFLQHRTAFVNRILWYSPYIYLTGLTGVGKSSFVEKHLAAEENTVLYQGEKSMQAWAEDRSDKRKILFIDEANITSREWSEFEGLFNKPPGIVINGVYYELSDNHKVVFAGNPLSYGSGRKLAPLFDQHGNAFVFDPMPSEFIYEAILKPVFMGTSLEHHALDIAVEILNVYRFLCECSRDEVLISPRELQMMALLVLSNHDKRNVHPIELARYYSHLVARPLVPDREMSAFDYYFSPNIRDNRIIEKQTPEFVVTPSREPLYHLLSDFTGLREYRRSRAAVTDEQRYGGLGGIVIEGDPGIGKSELVVAHLVAHGYTEAALDGQTVSENVFYKMPVSMQFDEKQKLLMKAFHEGAIVIIDEINSSPMMERLLNDLLMGKAPDGSRPVKPGFMIIGTQNPITMGGRHQPSTALARRLMTTYLPTYPAHEMNDILVNRGVNRQDADVMVNSYMRKVSQAKWGQLTPAPTFRGLLNFADSYLEGKRREPHLSVRKEAAVYEASPVTHYEPETAFSHYGSQTLFGGDAQRPQPEGQTIHVEHKDIGNKEVEKGNPKKHSPP